MRLFALGILAALLSAGCALETGEPGQPVETAETVNTPSQLGMPSSPKIHTSSASTAPTGTAPNPEPSPWFPQSGNVAMPDDESENPEPSPWGKVPTVSTQGSPSPDNTQPNSGSSRGGSGSEEPDQPLHIVGHRDVSDPQL
jgi:hypothetical protein